MSTLFNDDMTMLANAIRDKAGISGKLSIYDMVEAVRTIDVESTPTGPGSGGSTTGTTVQYGYKMPDGRYQIIDISGSTIQESIYAISADAITFDTGKEAPVYTGDSSPSAGSGISFYECVSYDDGGVQPAYSNIEVSSTATTTSRGVYKLIDRKAKGSARVWRNSNNHTVQYVGSQWVIMSAQGEVLYYAPAGMDRTIASTEEGTVANPTYWDTATADSPALYRTSSFNCADCENYRKNFYVYLEAGIEYRIGVAIDSDDWSDMIVGIFDANNSSSNIFEDALAYADDDSMTIEGISCPDAFAYTPTESGLYRISAGGYSDAYVDCFVVCYPMSVSISEPWESQWFVQSSGAQVTLMSGVPVPERPATGIKLWSGTKMEQDPQTSAWSSTNELKEDMPVNGVVPKVGEIYSADTTIRVRKMYDGAVYPITSDGLVFYAPLQTDYVDIVSGEAATVTGGTFTEHNGLRCLELDGSEYAQWPDNTDLPAGNVPYSFVVMVAPTNNYDWKCYASIGYKGSDEICIHAKNGKLEDDLGSTTMKNDGTWYALALTRDTSGGAKTYLNGKFEGSGNRTTSVPSPAHVCVGTQANGTGHDFTGYIAFVAIYNRELSADEVLEIHNTLMDM